MKVWQPEPSQHIFVTESIVLSGGKRYVFILAGRRKGAAGPPAFAIKPGYETRLSAGEYWLSGNWRGSPELSVRDEESEGSQDSRSGR